MPTLSENLSFFDRGFFGAPKLPRTPVDRPTAQLIGPKGLMVRDPYATQLLDGQKVWEIRGRSTQIRGRIVIIKSGTGRAYGTVNLVRVLGPLSLDDLIYAPELPIAERNEFERDGLPYAKTYAYVVSDPKWFAEPVPYNHPSGAVTWVRLPEFDLNSMAYAYPTDQRSYG